MQASATSPTSQVSATRPGPSRLRRYASFAIWSWLYIPALWVAAFWSLVLRARLHLGEWPRASRGVPPNFEPASIDPAYFGLHTTAVWLLLMPVVFAWLWAFAVICVLDFSKDRRLGGISVAAFGLGSLCIVATIVDLGGFWGWFLD